MKVSWWLMKKINTTSGLLYHPRDIETRQRTLFSERIRQPQRCWRCGGAGFDEIGCICISCDRTGRVRCSDCEGRKKLACSLCKGSGKLKHFDQLVVTWKYQKCSEISNVSELATELVSRASGKKIYKDEGVTVQPLNFPNNRYLNEISARLIASQNSQRDVRIAAQRHSVIAIPYTRATYIWKKKKGNFYVYGFQKNEEHNIRKGKSAYCKRIL
ncbi:hypothetical protein TNCV_2190811 [Trichonephila clavipes]|uniref:Uncharacterized protein n=1 Tax=Trichonephila clavipes TaxID=2585209 RepID=A0A8X6R598_TRICX|nr:hypothetical protein TNCV_2190811 [Trichonephila clavipes]